MTILVKKCKTLKDYIRAEQGLSRKEKEIEFEDFVGLWLKVHPGFGPNVYSPNNNEVPNKLQKKFKISSLMRGQSSLGTDWYTGNEDELKGIECKYQHSGSSITLHKLAPKEVALKKTKITEKYLATNMSKVSHVITEFLGDWTPIFGDDIYTEDSYNNIKKYLANSNNNFSVLGRLAGYREALLGPEKGSDIFHRQSIKDMFAEIEVQIGFDGKARLLSIKPTSAGKSLDPILLWYNYLLPKYFGEKDKILTIGVNPRLTILNGNTVKRIYDYIARKPKNTKNIVIASELDMQGGNDSEREELESIKQYVKVISPGKNNKNILNELAEWKRKGHHLHIETTVHSYYLLGEVLKKLDITTDFMSIDEVKNTVLEKDSTRTDCLFDSTGEVTIRLGMDANIVGTNTDNKKEYDTSMLNKDLWRNFTQPNRDTPVQWEEIECTSRGFKRSAKVHITQIDINDLPSVLSNARINKTRDLIKYKKQTVPLSWALKLQVWALLLLDDPRNYPLLQNSNRKRVADFVKFANVYWPDFVKTLGDSRTTEIKNLLKMKFVDIYKNGVTHNVIMNTVNSIQEDYPSGAFVVQCKKLSEGWDPTDGWIDAGGFNDPSWSKTHIGQTFGRAQRGKGTALLSEIMFTDRTQEHTIKNEFQRVAEVCNLLSVGSNINDSITITKYDKSPSTGGSRSGNKIRIAVHELKQADEITKKVFSDLITFGNMNPFSPIVNELFESRYGQQYFDIALGRGNEKKKIVLDAIEDPQFADFFSQYGNNCKNEYAAKRHKFADIMKGRHFLLTDENKEIGKAFHRKYVLDEKLKHKKDALKFLKSAQFVINNANVENYAGNIKPGIILLIRKEIKKHYKGRMLSEGQNAWMNKTLLRRFPFSGKIILKSYINLLDNFVSDVEDLNNKMIKRVEELQQLTTGQSFSGTLKGIVTDMVLNEFGILKKTNCINTLLVNSKYSLKECEQFAKNNQKMLVDWIEKNYKKYNSREEQWTELDKFVSDTDLIHSLSNEKVNNLCPSKKEIESYFQIKAAKRTAREVCNRKDYVNPSAKTFIADGIEYESAGQANRSIEIRDVRTLAKYRSDVYYFKEDGPKPPKNVRFHNTPYGYGPKTSVFDLCKTAGEKYASQYSQGSIPEWWKKVSTLHPEEFFVEERPLTIDEIKLFAGKLSSMVMK